MWAKYFTKNSKTVYSAKLFWPWKKTRQYAWYMLKKSTKPSLNMVINVMRNVINMRSPFNNFKFFGDQRKFINEKNLNLLSAKVYVR